MITVRQVVFADDGGATGQTQTVTLVNVQQGSLIHVFVTDDDLLPAISTLSDPTNGNYTQIELVNDTGGTAQRLYSYFVNNVQFRPGNLVITGTWASATAQFKGLAAVEISLQAQNPLIGHVSNRQTAPGTGVNAITVGPPSVSNAIPALALAITEGGGNNAPNVGTGFTSQGTGWGFGAAATTRMESQRLVGKAAPCTFTATNGADHYVSQMVVYGESGSGIVRARLPRL